MVSIFILCVLGLGLRISLEKFSLGGPRLEARVRGICTTIELSFLEPRVGKLRTFFLDPHEMFESFFSFLEIMDSGYFVRFLSFFFFLNFRFFFVCICMVVYVIGRGEERDGKTISCFLSLLFG